MNKNKTHDWFCTIDIKYGSSSLFDRPEIVNILAAVRFERCRWHDPKPKTLLLLDRKKHARATSPILGSLRVGDHNSLQK